VSTLGELRAALRVVLNDGDQTAGYMWSDGQLNRYLQDAVRGYGRHFPREMSESIPLIVSQASYPLPPDCERVLRVELIPTGNSGGEALVEGGDAYGWGYRVFGGMLVLSEAPSVALGTLAVGYLGAYTELVADDSVPGVPVADEDMLLSLAGCKAVASLATDEAKRAQFEDRAGRSAVEASEGYKRGWDDGVRAKRHRMRAGRLAAR
jgi:hypothetical protein